MAKERSPARCFVDTWAWLVLANDRDPAFAAVSLLRSEAAGRAGAWITTDYVLDETLTRLFAAAPFAKARRFAEAIFQAAELGLVDIERVTPERFQGPGNCGCVIATSRESRLPTSPVLW